MFDLNDIAVFVKVVETGSFIGASRALGIPKTTVSRQVAQLETNLGARLLHRTTRKLKLTEVGTAYFDRCLRIMEDIEEANLAVTATQSIPQGTLRITATENFGTKILNQWLLEFLQNHEQVNAEVLFSSNYIDLVAEGMDIAFRFGPLEGSSLISRHIGSILYWLCASPDYLRSRGEPKKPQDLTQHSCIVVGSLPGGGQWRFTGSAGEEVIAVSGRVKANNVILAQQAVLAGLGIAYLPSYKVAEDIKAGRLVRILTQWTTEVRNLYAVYPSDRHLSPKVRAFLDFIATKPAYPHLKIGSRE